jgi:hypothetical protein
VRFKQVLEVLIQAMHQVLPSVKKFDKVNQCVSKVMRHFNVSSSLLSRHENGSLEQNDLNAFLNETVTSWQNAARAEKQFIKVFVDTIWPVHLKLKMLFETLRSQLKIRLQ